MQCGGRLSGRELTRNRVVPQCHILCGFSMAFPMLGRELVSDVLLGGSSTSAHLCQVLVSSPFVLRWPSTECVAVVQGTKNRTILRKDLGESVRDQSIWRALTGPGS